VRNTTLTDAELEQEVLAIFRGITFSPLPGAPELLVTYAMVFSPTSGTGYDELEVDSTGVQRACWRGLITTILSVNFPKNLSILINVNVFKKPK